MPVFGSAHENVQPLGLHFDFVARIADIVARKYQEIPGSLGAFLHDIERKVLSTGLRGTLKSLVQRFQKDRAGTAGPAVDLSSQADLLELERYSEWMMLTDRIQHHGRVESIENYPEYMISLDGL